MGTWSLKSVVDPLAAKLSASESKQLARYLKEEKLGTLAAARKNDEMSMQLVRIVDGKGKQAFALFLSSFGSGALFDAGTTTLVGNVIQHSYEPVVERDGLAAGLAKAFTKKEIKRLGIETALSFDARKVTKKSGGGTLEAALALPNRGERRNAVGTIAETLFGSKAAPYPKRRLNAEQRAFVEAVVDAQADVELHMLGLFSDPDHLARAVGKGTSGPSDVVVSVGKEKLPLWCAVSDVASGHLAHAPVLAAFEKLAKADALAAWNEIAAGKAYDLFEAHPLTDAESGIPRTPNNVKHRTRLFSWMADANVALGEPGRLAAEQLTKTKITLDYTSGYPWAFIALLSLVRQGVALPETYDDLVARLDGNHADAFAAPIVKEIEKTLPKPRLDKIAAIREKRKAV